MALRTGGGAHETRRVEQRPWRDLRVVLGVVVVLGSSVLGGVVMASQDRRTEYWALRDDVSAQDRVTRGDLVATSAHLDGSARRTALAVDEELPAALDDLVWQHDLPAGSLLRAGDLAPRSRRDVVELPLSVALGSAPHDLSRGQVVDVWVGPGETGTSGGARRLLADVPVVSVGRGGSVSGGAARTVVVDTGTRDLDPSVVAGLGAGRVTLVRHS